MSFVRTKESKEHRHHWAVMELLPREEASATDKPQGHASGMEEVT